MMPLSAHLLLVVAALCCFTTAFAFPMEGFTKDHQCRCLTTMSNFINTRLFKKIEILPAGSHCLNMEIIITLRSNKTVCVDPETAWVQKLIAKITSSRNAVKK